MKSLSFSDAAGIPKADLHMHAETRARIDRLVSRRDGVAAYDWGEELRSLSEVPPGIERLMPAVSVLADNKRLDTPVLDALNEDDSIFVEWLAEALREPAAGGAILVEVRFGAKGGMRPGFMSLFRAAKERVTEEYPGFSAEALITSIWPEHPGAAEAFEDSLRAAKEGRAGVDFVPVPYGEEAHWSDAHVWASKAADAGLGVTTHVGEFSAANIEAALRLPGVSRLGHGVHAATSPRLLDQVLQSGVTLECCLTSNVVLGAVPSLEEHPIRELADAGVPITLASDDPVRLCTGISREYELAAGLGFSTQELLGVTRRAVAASFTSPERRERLLGVVDRALASK
jgi:adenosine deaminase